MSRVAPYSRVRLDWLASELNVSPSEAETLAVSVILDGRLPGASIDQVKGVLNLAPSTTNNATPLPFGHVALVEAASAATAAAVASGKIAVSAASGDLGASSKASKYAEVERLADKLNSLIGNLAAGALPVF